jgi:hypothetical protein
MFKLKDEKQLKEVLYSEDYDKIIFWKDGTWNPVSSSYAGEQDGYNPIYVIKRVEFSNVTRVQVNEFVNHYLVYNIEEQMDAIKQ